ncbi:unnamed protein product [Camellia sinensis]
MADTLAALRSLMSSHSPPLDALVVPSEDYHQSEYLSDRDKRREFVSGFTGSAGLALITMNEALLWTDGRYFLQAAQELSDQWKLMRMGGDSTVDVWMADLWHTTSICVVFWLVPIFIGSPDAHDHFSVVLWNLPKEAAVGIDLWCVSVDTAQKWEYAFCKKQQKLVQTSTNLVDKVWKNQPPVEINPVNVHPLEFAGRSVANKVKDLREKLKQEEARAIIITALDEVAWLYNVRGNNVSYYPVVHAFAIVTSLSAFFYVDERKLSSEVNSYLKQNGIEVRDYAVVSSDVVLLASNQLRSSSSANETPSDVPKDMETENGTSEAEDKNHNLIWIDSGSCCFALYSKLNSDQNPVELDGLKKAHIRDGAAVVQYLFWLDKQMQEIYGASGYFMEAKSTNKKKHPEMMKLTEVSASDKLEGFRASKEHFRGLSFPTISSVGPNAAIIHYEPDPKTCSELDADSIYLFDSGAQFLGVGLLKYLDGTTDITRAVHFGKPTAHEKACYTVVLKGHIALGNACFPNGTNEDKDHWMERHALDILARIPLWKDGLDYRHGTGHGIGSYLNVHEGPHLISFRPHARNVPIQASMTVTDEPGYYEDGNFGIRLGNVLAVIEAGTKFNFGDKGYLSFEHITWAPYQQKLIDLSLLMPEEVDWWNSYHSKCRDVLASYMNESEMAWLKKATELICA